MAELFVIKCERKPLMEHSSGSFPVGCWSPRTQLLDGGAIIWKEPGPLNRHQRKSVHPSGNLHWTVK